MKKLLGTLFTLFAITVSAQDKKGCDTVEPKYLGRMPGYFLIVCKHSEFDSYNFAYMDLKDKYTRKRVSGRFFELRYEKDPKEPRPFSGFQICTNYENAVKKVKGQSLSFRKNFFQLSQNGKQIWFKIDEADDTDDRGFLITIIEEESMKQDVVLKLDEAIDRDGKIALYGIQFDVNKAVIKPESEPVLQKIIDYLNANAAVKIYIVGHTDNTGVFANNIKLSKDRAEAVKDYLVAKGKINPSRLQPDGVASLCPVSTNSTEEGKTLNRRVEIVKQ